MASENSLLWLYQYEIEMCLNRRLYICKYWPSVCLCEYVCGKNKTLNSMIPIEILLISMVLLIDRAQPKQIQLERLKIALFNFCVAIVFTVFANAIAKSVSTYWQCFGWMYTFFRFCLMCRSGARLQFKIWVFAAAKLPLDFVCFLSTLFSHCSMILQQICFDFISFVVHLFDSLENEIEHSNKKQECAT